MVSTSYSEFNSGLQRIKYLLDLERKNYKEPIKTDEILAVEALRGGAVVLLVGMFEQCIKEMINEYIEDLTKNLNSANYANLPQILQTTNVFVGLNRVLEDRSKDKNNRISAILSTCKTITEFNLEPLAFTDTRSNPNSEQLKTLLKNIDMNDPYATLKSRFTNKWKTQVTDRFIPDKLDEIISKRNLVAHTGKAISVLSREDLKEYFRFIKILARILDIEIRIQMLKIKKSL